MTVPPRPSVGFVGPRLLQDGAGDAEVLQGLVDDVGAGFGFRRVVVGLVRERLDELEYVAVSGSDGDGRPLVGAHVPVRELEKTIASAEDWGAALRFVPHVVSEGDGGAPVDSAWHPDDLLVAELTDAGGALRGALFLKDPYDGRLPDQVERARLGSYVAEASRLLVQADRRQRYVQRVRLSELLGEVLRRASESRADARTLVEECLPVIARGLGAAAAWWHLTGEQVWHAPAGGDARIPQHFDQSVGRSLVEVAGQLWRDQAVGVLALRRTLGPSSKLAELAGLLEPWLSIDGEPEVLVVPLGAGADLEGTVVLVREPGAPDWGELEIDTAQRVGRDLGAAVVARRSAQQSARLHAFRTDSVATLVHELKNPLTALRGHIELLEMASVDPLAERSLRAISTAADQLQRTVQDLLLYARYDRDPETADRRPVDLVGSAHRMVELFSAEAEAAGVELVVDVPGEPVSISADEMAIERLFSNLVGNAVKYSDAGSVVVVSLHAGAHEAVIEVSDQGIGIGAEELEKLFLEFFRSADPQAQTRPGTGLGLAVVRRIVEQHGGVLTVESELGEGSLFTVRLPR